MTDEPSPDSLRPGSLVGPWRIEGYAGRGTYGVVFRARRAGHPGSMPVALKMALFAYDPRFLREVELLSRARHPSIPLLLDRGWWTSTEGRVHPYLVMEWSSGVPLYEWARATDPSSRQVLQVLAQVAWGLEVLHRADGLHRDVKGDNILVDSEGRAFLTDFGSGTWAGAPPLTDSLMPPGTREYRGPEAVRFQWAHLRQRDAHYAARTHDDLYALGVSAYRLVTGLYPPPGTDPEARMDPLRVPLPPRESPTVLNPRVIPELAALIERMLAAEPEGRGLAREVAEAAEVAAERAGPAADVPLSGVERPRPVVVAVPAQARAEPEVPQVQPKQVPVELIAAPRLSVDADRLRGRITLTLALLTVAGIWWMGHGPYARTPRVTQHEASDDGVPGDEDPASLADASVTTRASAQVAAIASASITLDMPPDPLPGQLRTPCRRRGAIEINGGCWIRWTDLTPPCGDDAYEWKHVCYWPIYERSRPPTTKKPRESTDP